MPDRHRPRLYVGFPLTPGGAGDLEPGQAHYLRSVFRLGVGALVAAFNEADGEWYCRIVETGKSHVRLRVEKQSRSPEPETDLWLLFAPIKRARLDWLVEKATELGVSALLPMWTARTQVERINLERLQAHAIEAAEQSERLSVPKVHLPEGLDKILASWPADRQLILCDETGAGEPLADAATRLAAGPTALLIGPEGGFDQRELDAMSKLSFVSRVGLGPRVLRAETAALAGLAVFQAIAGDWCRIRTR